MADDVTRDEFTHLEARVSVVEGEVEGEKLVTRHILEHTRRNSADLATIKTQLDCLGRELRGELTTLRGDLTGLRGDFVSLQGTLHGLASNLPRIVGEVMREVLRDDKR